MSVTSAALLRACSLLLCLVAGSRQLSIKEFVVPKEVEVGKDAELRCQYKLGEGETEDSLFVKWWWTPDATSTYDRKLIYQRIANHEARTISHVNASKIDIKDNDSIVLLNVSTVDSGIYECEVSNIEEIRNHENLTVFSMGTGPEINYTLLNSEEGSEKDTLVIECEAEDVAPLPDMTITFQGESMNITKIVEDTDQDGLYKIYANTTVSLEDIEESEILCKVFYNNFEHQAYVDVETFTPPGRAASPSTDLPEDATEPEATQDSLQNSSDHGIQLQCSWVLLTLAAIATYLGSKI